MKLKAAFFLRLFALTVIICNVSAGAISGKYFKKADLSKTVGSNTDSSNNDLPNTDLSNKASSNTDLINADPSNTDTSNTGSSNTALSNIDLSNTDLSNKDLSNTDGLNIDVSGKGTSEGTSASRNTASSTDKLTASSAAYELSAKRILNKMTLKEKVGQMFFVRLKEDSAIKDINSYHFGGYVLFSNNFEGKTKKGITLLIKSYQNASKIPLLIGVDEEGGTVNRISKYKAFRAVPFSSPQTLYRQGGYSQIISDTIEKAKLLKSLGINVNLAPVCDVSTDPDNFIYQRSFGKNAYATSKYVKTVVSTMNAQGIGSTLKHFPGYGNNADTHTGSVTDHRSRKSFETSDFLPFEAGIKAGAGSILVSHNIVTAFDKSNPASLSPAVHDILRNKLGFSGVIMTDDLSMGAIKNYTPEKAAVLAVCAGNDLILTSDYQTQIPAIINAVKAKTISEERINESVLHILIWKLSLGMITSD